MRPFIGSACRSGRQPILAALLSTVDWRGDEIVLNIGCGDGHVTIAAAKMLLSGYAVGVDDWSRHGWYLNDSSRAVRSAQVAGVRSKAMFQNADARDLPFEDCSFDIVVSINPLGFLSTVADRALALNEMIRVTRRGGRCSLFETRNVEEYTRRFAVYGFSSLAVSKPTWRFARGRIVTGVAPGPEHASQGIEVARSSNQSAPLRDYSKIRLPPWIGDE